jgi:PAS domain S-box-containing protein
MAEPSGRARPRRNVADQHRHAGECLRIVAETLSVAVTECSRDLQYRWVSKTYADWLGQPADEIVGHSIEDVIGADALAAIRPYINRTLAGERVEYRDRVPFRGLGLRWIHATYTPVYAHGPNPTGWVAIVVDVTDRRRVEDELRESETQGQLLAAIVESSDDAIVSKDLQGTVTSWNAGAERMFGYTAEDIVGRSIRTIIPDERQFEEDEVLARIRRGETVDQYETVRRRKDGTRISVSLRVSPVRNAAGAIVGASKIARDISQQQLLARQSAFLAEAGAVLGSSLDYESTLRAVANLAVPTIADWCALDIVEHGQINRLAVAHIDPTKIPFAKALRDRYENPAEPYSVPAVIGTGVPAMIAEITDEMITRAARGDEERIRLVRSIGLRSYICVPLIAHGQTLGALTLATAESGRRYTNADLRFAQDVGYRVALAIDNARAYDLTQRANRLKDEFLATLSHELRTPLNAILGYSRMIRAGLTTGEKQTKAIATVERNATSLTQIVEDVLDVSRIISGKLRLNVQPVELPGVVANAVDSILPAANAKGVSLKVVSDQGAAPVSGDPERLQQVVWNLVANGVKFTPRGGQVQVRVERVNSHVEIVVSDSGIGIPKEFLPYIFERFRQADAGTTREQGGLGLGLAITRHLVEMHGGTVHAASPGPGGGATFRVKLPVMIVHAEEQTERRVHPRDPRTDPRVSVPNLDGIRVLAVDDDGDALVLVGEILEAAGAHVTAVDSASAAIEALETSQPDVLLADLGMPHIDGFELITRVRRSTRPATRDIPAAALTAYARSEDRARALRTGFQMHLAKPIDPGELMAAVAALARRNQPD